MSEEAGAAPEPKWRRFEALVHSIQKQLSPCASSAAMANWDLASRSCDSKSHSWSRCRAGTKIRTARHDFGELSLESVIGSHIISKFYLERFAVKRRRKDRSGRLWAYGKGSPVRCGAAANECVEFGYFGLRSESGELDERMEFLLQEHETQMGVLLPMLSCETAVFDRRACCVIAEFIALTFARSLGRFDGQPLLNSMAANLFRELQHEGFFDALAQELGDSVGRAVTSEELNESATKIADQNVGPAESKRAFISRLFVMARPIAERLLAMPWQVWHAPEGSQFVTSDTPVVTAMPLGAGLSLGFGFNRPGVLVFFPLCHSACFVAGKEGPGHIRIDAASVKLVNDVIIKFSRRNVFSREYSGDVDAAVQRYGGIAKFGENVFAPTADRVAQWKLACRQIVRREFGLHPPLVLATRAWRPVG